MKLKLWNAIWLIVISIQTYKMLFVVDIHVQHLRKATVVEIIGEVVGEIGLGTL
tara:strand:+ start:319 stop:480 length:162 start_codon:yes stop_codon:yes gene_type:complete